MTTESFYKPVTSIKPLIEAGQWLELGHPDTPSRIFIKVKSVIFDESTLESLIIDTSGKSWNIKNTGEHETGLGVIGIHSRLLTSNCFTDITNKTVSVRIAPQKIIQFHSDSMRINNSMLTILREDYSTWAIDLAWEILMCGAEEIPILGVKIDEPI